MVKTKRILIALAVIGTNMLYNMPVYTSLAAEPDYTITHGTTLVDSPYSDSHTYSSVVIGNTGVLDGILSDIDMVIRSGTYNASSVEGCVQMVGSNVAGANISNNHLTINNATINTLYGAHYKYNDYPSVNGTLENNSITIHNGFYRNVYTAYAYYGNLTGNILTVEGGTFQQYMNEYIAAGYVQSSGNVLSNRFIINGGTFKKYKSIYGGYVASGNAIGNVVTINNGAFSDTDGWINVYGGFGQGGYLVDNGNVTKNKVDIKGGSFDIACSIYGGYLNGSSLHGSISENEVNVSGGTFNVKMSFCGGSLPRSDLNAVSIEKNKVTIKNVTLANGSEIYGGQSSKVKIDSNNVTIDSGTFNNVVIVGGKSETADVLNNSVILKGGNFAGGTKIIAGIGVSDSAKFSGNSISLAGSNAIDLSGASLMGYDTTGFANSTLNVGRANVKVQDIKNFGTINFNLAGASSDANVLKMQGSALDLSSWNVANITVSGITLDDDDYITLMKNVSGSFGGTVTAGNVTVVGTELVYYTGTTPAALKADYTITQGSSKSEGNSGIYTSEIAGNTALSTSNLNGINMVVRRGTYENTIYAVKYDGDVQTTEISGNKVTIYDGSFKEVYSAYAKNGQVTGNILTIEDGTFGEGMSIYAGYIEQNGNAEGNKIFINGGETGDNKTIAAGYIGGTGDATNNEITITGGKVGGNNFIKIYGAKVTNGSAKNNAVNINGAWVGKWADIYGGYAKTDSADYNVVKIENTTVSADCTVYGGNSYENYGSPTGKDAKNNRVEILDGVTMEGDTYFKTVYGGKGAKEVSNNAVLIKSGAYQAVVGGVSCYDYGPYDYGVSGNSVKMTGGTLVGGTSSITGVSSCDGHIYGGIGGNMGTVVTENTVELDGVTIKDSIKIYGAFSLNNATVKNSVTVANLQCEPNKYSEIYGGYSGVNSSSENKVTIKSGAWEKVYGGWGNTGADSNKVIIDGGSLGNDNSAIYGGYSSNGDATYNGVEINAGSFSGADSAIYGGYTSSGNANNNYITINAGTFDNSNIGAGTTDDGNSNGNTVIVNGGNFEGYSSGSGIWSGYVVTGSGSTNENKIYINGGTFGDNISFWGAYGSSGEAKDNIVEIAGGTFGNNFGLYGGYTGGTSTNNTLNLKIKMGGKASEVKYFQNMNFTLPSGTDDGTPMLKTETVTFDDTTINVNASLATLSDGQIITLIAADNEPTGTYTPGTITGVGEAIITLDGYDLILKIITAASGGDEDQQKAPVEGIAAAMQTVNMSADLASGEGMKSLIAETAGGVTNTFGALTTGQSKYKTGSHVDIDGWGLLVGAGKTKEWGNGEATSLGVFFEYGKGDFDTYNGNVHGDGNSKNQGIGIMMRHKMLNNTYYEGNIRYGKQSTEWSESEIGSYDTDSRYYGIMVGMGHIFPAGKNEIDVYGRYTYGHVGACDAKVGDNHYHFDSVKSHRVRVGGKYNFKVKNSNAKPFIGLAWEHEFKGESKASISGVGEAPAPSMKGHTGIMEVGCDWKVSKKWTLGLGANAYMGKRKGWDGMARVFYNF